MKERLGAVRSGLILAITWLVLGTSPAPLQAQICVPLLPCWESPGGSIRVVDRQTGQPLAGVHALAEWIIDGGLGQRHIFMAQDAVSGPDGRVVFPPWGPLRGGGPGMLPHQDPVITLFRPGYVSELDRGKRVIYNTTTPNQTDLARVRRFGRDGATVGMEPFQGDTTAWVAHLKEAAFPDFGAGANDSEWARIRVPIRNRLDLVAQELTRQPQDRLDVKDLTYIVNRERESSR
jgi:hypothetical protein